LGLAGLGDCNIAACRCAPGGVAFGRDWLRIVQKRNLINRKLWK
jgi:hypothetical protein